MNKSKNNDTNSIARTLTKPNSDLCLCMILDFPNMSERIIIGSKSDIKNKLRKLEHDNQIIFDRKRDLGQLFLDIKNTEKDKWKAIIEEMQSKLWNFNSLKKETRDYLIAQNTNNNPINLFLALCLRKDYYANKTDIPSRNIEQAFFENLNDKISYISSFHTIVKSLSIEISNKKKTYTSNLPVLPESIQQNESYGREGTFWHTPNRSVQCIFCNAEISALLDYYIYSLQTHKYRFQICNHCEKYFLTQSLSVKLCSDECKAASKLSALKKYKDNHSGNPEDNEYSRLAMRLRRNIDRDSKLNDEQKIFLQGLRKEILSIANKGKRKVFNQKESFAKYQSKTKEYENTFTLYHAYYSRYTELLAESRYNEINKSRISNVFLPIRNHIISNLKEIDDNNMSLENHINDLKRIFTVYEDFLKKLN
ncbi:MAG: hypothetical protein IKY30_04905 [Oscillospiraceae bacterium]|nr:hypothetical protein [Oscillospiraceae bacterium]